MQFCELKCFLGTFYLQLGSGEVVARLLPISLQRLL